MSRISIRPVGPAHLPTAFSPCAWACCGVGAGETIGYAVPSAALLARWASVYQIALEQAVRTAQRALPGRIVPPSMN